MSPAARSPEPGQVKSGRCQRGSRIVPAASADPGTANMYWRAGHLYLYRPWPGHPRPWWSRLVHADVCSSGAGRVAWLRAVGAVVLLAVQPGGFGVVVQGVGRLQQGAAGEVGA